MPAVKTPMDKLIQLDAARSSILGKTIASKPTTPFDNASNGAIALVAELGELAEIRYVQGFLLKPGDESFQPIEHAWVELELADGITRIDPSFRHFKKTAEELSYFPAHYIEVPDLQEAIVEAREDYPEDPPLPIYSPMPYEFYGDLMLGDKTYQVAFDAAKVKCKELNRPGRPNLKN